MAENLAYLEDILAPGERARIEADCATLSDPSTLAEYLSTQFSLAITTDPDVVQGYKEDSSHLSGEASCLCRVRTERECAIIAQACSVAGVPFTVSAGRSNLTGSATPNGGVIVCTEAMILPAISVDAEEMTVTSPVGIFLEDLRERIMTDTDGTLFFPVDPTSRSEATVGGAISCNASGFTPGSAGSMRHWVDSVDIILPNGLKLRAGRGQCISDEGKCVLVYEDRNLELPLPRYSRPSVKNAAGPYSAPDGAMDIVDLIVGSEGIFGIVTSCVLRLQRRPIDYLDLFFSLPAEDNAVALLAFLQGHLPGGIESLSAFEYFGANCRQYMDHEAELFHGDDPVAVYVQQPLTDMNAENAMESWFDVLTQDTFGIDEAAILLLDSDRTRSMFIEARHSMPANSLEVVQRRGTHTIMTDTVVPSDRFEEFLSFAHGALEAEHMDYLSFGHFGDCHLHFMILPESEQLARAIEIYDQLVSRSAALGGVYSGEHGTGKRKRHDFALCYGEQAVAQIRRCKAAVDPQFLLNRGNVIESAV